MDNEELYEDNLIVDLTIEGTEYEDIPIKVTNPNKTIREQIDSIIQVFELPTHFPNGLPRQYLLGQMLENGEEPEILDFEDEEGNEQSLADYNIQRGDHLHLIEPPLYGCLLADDDFGQNDRNGEGRNDKGRKPFWHHILYGCWL